MREYNHNGLAGCVQQHKNRETGTQVSVFQGIQAGMAQDPKIGIWVTVCEDHSSFVLNRSLEEAKLSAVKPTQFCGECRND